jgi:hypothetical protein
LYYSQFSDLYKFWLHVDGPALIYDKVADIRGIEREFFPHECQYCIELVHNKENYEVMIKLFETELPGIIFRHSIRKTSLKINK